MTERPTRGGDTKRSPSPILYSASTHAPNSSGFGGIARSAGAYLMCYARLGVSSRFVASDASFVKRASAARLMATIPLVKAEYYRTSEAARWGFGLGLFRHLPIPRRTHVAVVHGVRTWPTVVVGLWCRACRIPYHVVAHAGLDSTRVERTRRKRPRLFALCEPIVRFSVKGARSVVVSGEQERLALLPWCRGMAVSVIENFFDFPESAAILKTKGRHCIFLFAGRIDSDKGILAFAKIWCRVAGSGSRLWLAGAGAGSYFENVLAIVRQDDRIEFLGELTRDQVAETMLRANFVVLPTGLDDPVTENFGNVVVEGLIAATPVLVSEGLHWDSYSSSAAIDRFALNEDSVAGAIVKAESYSEEEYSKKSSVALQLSKEFHISRAHARLEALLFGSKPTREAPSA